nr:MAG TPA: hypothetical protein [Crassvirales sp.]
MYYHSPFLRRMYHTTSAHGNPCEQGNNAEPRANHRPDDTLAGRVGWLPSSYFPVCGYVCCG